MLEITDRQIVRAPRETSFLSVQFQAGAGGSPFARGGGKLFSTKGGVTMDGKFLGKIRAVEFGIYDHSRFGLSLDFSLDGGASGVGTFTGAMGLACKVGEYTKWTEANRDADFAKLCRFVNQTLLDAKRTSLMELEDIPVEVTIERGTLKSWRVLTEVL